MWFSFFIIPGECGKCNINFSVDTNITTVVCKYTFLGNPLSLTSKVKYCDTKVEIDINILGEHFSHVVEADATIPLPVDTISGKKLALRVKLTREIDRLSLEVS